MTGAAPPADPLVEAVQAVARRIVGATAAALAPSSRRGSMRLTLPEYRTLVLLVEGGSLAPFEIADGLGVTRPAVTRIIRGLSRRRLIERRRHSADRRRAEIRPSDRGRSIVEGVVRERARRLEPALRGLTRGERKTLTDLLSRIDASLASAEKAP